MAVRAAAYVDDVAAAVTTANKADTAVDATRAATTKADEVGAFCSFAAATPVQTRRRETGDRRRETARHETGARDTRQTESLCPLR
jgi:hypothetical protein